MQGLHRPEVAATLRDLHTRAETTDKEVFARAEEAGASPGAERYRFLAEAYLPIDPANGELLHALALARRPGRIVEFGTSMGLSTIYLAAALRPGDAPVITSELEPQKVKAARENLVAAGLADVVEVREGDALVTLSDIDEPVSLVLLDGWKELYLDVLLLLEPHLVAGAVVVADDTGRFAVQCKAVLDHLRAPESGYATASVDVGDGIEIAVKR